MNYPNKNILLAFLSILTLIRINFKDFPGGGGEVMQYA